ncbi:hypothetical protein GCM10023193_08100 [Planotetraspora kaengkrachanensis]|uniref:Uncharacterized protein n=1 Tax=Planotetraspora kaengkrachanensis TaxID=575193 RepID=A0A8J3LWE9_9ACTN|nr:hypothetical protein Pka01_08700 [Planotetraspora kaengkrachanensis]
MIGYTIIRFAGPLKQPLRRFSLPDFVLATVWTRRETSVTAARTGISSARRELVIYDSDSESLQAVEGRRSTQSMISRRSAKSHRPLCRAKRS